MRWPGVGAAGEQSDQKLAQQKSTIRFKTHSPCYTFPARRIELTFHRIYAVDCAECETKERNDRSHQVCGDARRRPQRRPAAGNCRQAPSAPHAEIGGRYPRGGGRVSKWCRPPLGMNGRLTMSERTEARTQPLPNIVKAEGEEPLFPRGRYGPDRKPIANRTFPGAKLHPRETRPRRACGQAAGSQQRRRRLRSKRGTKAPLLSTCDSNVGAVGGLQRPLI
jgi:hypothetical protein